MMIAESESNISSTNIFSYARKKKTRRYEKQKNNKSIVAKKKMWNTRVKKVGIQ